MQIILNSDILGKNIQLLRKKYDLSQRALAKLTHVSVPQLRLIESGIIRQIDAQWLLRLCSIFEITGDDVGNLTTKSI